MGVGGTRCDDLSKLFAVSRLVVTTFLAAT